MSDNYIIFIPDIPQFIPDQDLLEDARARLAVLFPDSERIAINVSDQIQFVDCGSNFDRVSCPNCGSTIPVVWWQDRMDADFTKDGFLLTKHHAPCCDGEFNLNELHYEFQQGFAKFSIEIMNPTAHKPVKQAISDLEELFRTDLRVIYRRL